MMAQRHARSREPRHESAIRHRIEFTGGMFCGNVFTYLFDHEPTNIMAGKDDANVRWVLAKLLEQHTSEPNQPS
jgi:hypothetical protein